MLNLSNKLSRKGREGRRVFLGSLHFWGKSVQSNPEAYCCHLVKTNYNNWSLSVYVWASSASLYFKHFPPKQRKPPIENEMLFTSASLWLLSDGTVTVSSLYSIHCPHTHSHRCCSSCVITGLVLCWRVDRSAKLVCLCVEDLSRGHGTLNDFTTLPSTALGFKTNSLKFYIPC